MPRRYHRLRQGRKAKVIAMRLDCFKLTPHAPELRPARGRRDWMDSAQDRVPYRCLPLVMANSSGWELRLPCDIGIEWNGKADKRAIRISGYDPHWPVFSNVTSHFGYGIVTFQTSYLFRTPPGWAVWAMGPPNEPKEGIAPLTGLIETDWLPFSFTMNWKFTRPGVVEFRKDEVFCFITLVEHRRLEAVEPVIRSLDSDPALRDEYNAWARSRAEFNEKLDTRDPDAMRQSWQRFYTRGESASGASAPEGHATRRRLAEPRNES